jgi:glycosyltransferase involved in cell wall biosynthesis
VINDGSTDGTPDKLKKFGNQISVVNQENIGESASVNVGINLAKSEIILVVSADDPLFTSELFSGVGKLFANDPDLVATYCDWIKIDKDGKQISDVKVADFDLNLLLGRSQCLPGPGTFFRKSAAIAVGGRNSDWRYVGDFDFWLRLSLQGKIIHRPVLAAQWRQHEASTSIKFRGAAMAAERIKVIEDFLKDSSGSLSSNLRRMAMGNAYYSAARLSYFDNSVNGKSFLLKAFLARKSWIENAKIYEILFIMLSPVSFKFIHLIRKMAKI